MDTVEGTRKVIAQEIHDLGNLKAVYREVSSLYTPVY